MSTRDDYYYIRFQKLDVKDSIYSPIVLTVQLNKVYILGAWWDSRDTPRYSFF